MIIHPSSGLLTAAMLRWETTEEELAVSAPGLRSKKHTPHKLVSQDPASSPAAPSDVSQKTGGNMTFSCGGNKKKRGVRSVRKLEKKNKRKLRRLTGG